MFVVQFATDGSDLWSRHVWGTSFMFPQNLTIDDTDNVFVAAVYARGSIHVGSFSDVASTTAERFLFARLGPNTGSTIWAASSSEIRFGTVTGLAVTRDRRRVLAAGVFQGALDLGDEQAPPLVSPDDFSSAGFLTRLVR